MNAGKRRWLIGALLGALVVPVLLTGARAATPISNLVLRPRGEFTELSVVGAARLLCDHFSEEPGNGHPFRVVLDFCDAEHALGTQGFESLPPTAIKRIRTSQYATNPQKIVRVVLDMQGPVTYTLVTANDNVTVRIVDAQHGDFSVWEANPSGHPVLATTVQTAKGSNPGTDATGAPSPGKETIESVNPPSPAVASVSQTTTRMKRERVAVPATQSPPPVPGAVITKPQAPTTYIQHTGVAPRVSMPSASSTPAQPSATLKSEISKESRTVATVQSSKPLSRPPQDVTPLVVALRPPKTEASSPVAMTSPTATATPKPATEQHALASEGTGQEQVSATQVPVERLAHDPSAHAEPVVIAAAPDKPNSGPVQNPYVPPARPLVFAPEYLYGDAGSTTPTVFETDKVPIAKVSMQPIGPQPPSTQSPGAATASVPEAVSAMVASTMAPGALHNTQGTTPQSVAINQTNSSSAPTGQESLLERLKAKFLTDQTPPRPYTTIEDDSPLMGNSLPGTDSLTANIYGPPSPVMTLDRQALLERIRRAGQAGLNLSDGADTAGQTSGAAGIPARPVVFYDDMGRRDPFAPLIKGQRSGFLTDQLPGVENLRLVGVLRDDKDAMALLENMEGYGYVMHVGDRVENGTVVAIQENRVLFRVEDYGWSHVVALQLTSRGTDPSKSLGANNLTPYQREYQTTPETEEQKAKPNETPKTENVNP